MKQLIAFATITNEINTWDEDFEVESKETAEAEVKEAINYFNRTLKSGEHPRTFKGIVHFEEKDIPEPEDDDYDEYGYDCDNDWGDYGDDHGDDDLEDDEY